jgi:hypothetical protein
MKNHPEKAVFTPAGKWLPGRFSPAARLFASRRLASMCGFHVWSSLAKNLLSFGEVCAD